MTSIALGNAATGMEAMQALTDVISGNIAHMKTPAYKEKLPIFSTLMSIDRNRVGSLSSSTGTIIPVGVQIGLGVQLQGVTSLMTQGNPVQTENPYNVAIQGGGYFQVELPSGETAYTRAGLFEVSPDGVLVTQEGFTVMPGISIPQDAVWTKINANGDVFVKIPGNDTPQNIGQLSLATFANPAGLESLENNMLMETPASGTAIVGQPGIDGFGKLLQNWYEGSNVNSVSAITSLIEAQRAFELNAKSAKTQDEMASQLNQIA